jgi:hypothetical protein
MTTFVTLKPRRLSLLDAASVVLSKASKPKTCVEIVELVKRRKLWSSKAKTPEITLHVLISREIAGKGSASRFVKVARGLFVSTRDADGVRVVE